MQKNKSVWAIQHVGYEDLGSFEPVLKKRGFDVRYLCSQHIDYKGLFAYDPDLLIDLGGPMGAYEDDKYPWILNELQFIKERIECEKPLMGICFGAQMIARALGAKVYKGRQGKELGWSQITVNEEGMKTPFRHFHGSVTQMMHWHGDTFDLPDGAVLLASSDRYQNQAYEYGHHIFGMQCHPEITESKLRLWYSAAQSDIEEVGQTVDSMKADADQYMKTLTQQTELFLNEWLDQQDF